MCKLLKQNDKRICIFCYKRLMQKLKCRQMFFLNNGLLVSKQIVCIYLIQILSYYYSNLILFTNYIVFLKNYMVQPMNLVLAFACLCSINGFLYVHTVLLSLMCRFRKDFLVERFSINKIDLRVNPIIYLQTNYSALYNPRFYQFHFKYHINQLRQTNASKVLYFSFSIQLKRF